jgi:hypothetical protein
MMCLKVDEMDRDLEEKYEISEEVKDQIKNISMYFDVKK